MEPEQIAVVLAEHGKEIGSLKHRMDNCEESQSELRELIRSVDKLGIAMEGMLTEQQKQGKRLERLEQSPGDDYVYYKRLIIGCIITGCIGAILGAVLALII